MNKTIVSLACGLTGAVLGTIIGHEFGNYLLYCDCIEDKDSHVVINATKLGAIIGGGIGTWGGMYLHDKIKK